ncbi:hypothetical protein ACJ41O_007187 [Fusarium nematophilum]
MAPFAIFRSSQTYIRTNPKLATMCATIYIKYLCPNCGDTVETDTDFETCAKKRQNAQASCTKESKVRYRTARSEDCGKCAAKKAK